VPWCGDTTPFIISSVSARISFLGGKEIVISTSCTKIEEDFQYFKEKLYKNVDNIKI